ncbi:hypothetical protein P3T76_010843 [Phytophthora citrophthora]|uniref:Uncharacterized protein n=1 Tax=Phytophthora citrophthora TaxID=4793 RepID=A0AAD9LGW8_9STRA|nr:hypothetical protein P3T76_010843 [Phytophthora citrophthora]
MPMDVKTPTGTFEHLPDALPMLKDYEIRQKLLQWNLNDTLQLQRFLVHRRLPSEADEALLTELFQDETAHRILHVRWHVLPLLHHGFALTSPFCSFLTPKVLIKVRRCNLSGYTLV